MGVYAIIDPASTVTNLICAGEVYAERIGAVPVYPGLSIGDTYIKPDYRTAEEKREEAYNTQPIIEWEGELLTVSRAARKWMYYAAEDNGKADELTALIAAAKQTIRAQYPDEEVAAE